MPRETEPASTPPDTAHPNTTEPLTVPTTSATEVAPTNSQPTTESPTTDTATTTGSRPTVPGPPIHEPLGALVPTLDGYETTPANEVYWPAYDLPGGARAYAADVAVGEDRIGQLVIAEGSGANQLTATYIANLFRNGAQMVGGMTEVDDGMFVVTNVAPVAWQAVNDAAVIVGTIEQDDVGAWTWDHDGRIWAVRGRIDAAGEYAEA